MVLVQLDDAEVRLLLYFLSPDAPLARSLRLAGDVQAFEESWGPRWTGGEPASALASDAALLHARTQREAPHLSRGVALLWADASRAARDGL